MSKRYILLPTNFSGSNFSSISNLANAYDGTSEYANFETKGKSTGSGNFTGVKNFHTFDSGNVNMPSDAIVRQVTLEVNAYDYTLTSRPTLLWSLKNGNTTLATKGAGTISNTGYQWYANSYTPPLSLSYNRAWCNNFKMYYEQRDNHTFTTSHSDVRINEVQYYIYWELPVSCTGINGGSISNTLQSADAGESVSFTISAAVGYTLEDAIISFSQGADKCTYSLDTSTGVLTIANLTGAVVFSVSLPKAKFTAYFNDGMNDVNLFGVNLSGWTANANSTYSKTISGLTLTYDPSDDTFTFNGTLAATGITFEFAPLRTAVNENYMLAATHISGSRPSSSVPVIELAPNANSTLSPRISMDIGGTAGVVKTITSADANAVNGIRLWVWSAQTGLTYSSFKVRIGVCKASTPVPFGLSGRIVTYQTAIGALPTSFPRSGFSFNGWFTSVSGGAQITPSTVFSNLGNATYYAHWNLISHLFSGISAASEAYIGTTPVRALYIGTTLMFE